MLRLALLWRLLRRAPDPIWTSVSGEVPQASGCTVRYRVSFWWFVAKCSSDVWDCDCVYEGPTKAKIDADVRRLIEGDQPQVRCACHLSLPLPRAWKKRLRVVIPGFKHVSVTDKSGKCTFTASVLIQRIEFSCLQGECGRVCRIKVTRGVKEAVARHLAGTIGRVVRWECPRE